MGPQACSYPTDYGGSSQRLKHPECTTPVLIQVLPFTFVALNSGTRKAETQLLLNQNSSASQPLLFPGFYSMERLTSTIFARPTGATYTVQGTFQPIKAFPWVIRRNKSQLCLNEARSKLRGGYEAFAITYEANTGPISSCH
jgi:hypothetical protein